MSRLPFYVTESTFESNELTSRSGPKTVNFARANVIRSLFTNRFDPARRALGRLLVVVAGGIELYELAATEVSTLHGICEAFYLPDLSEADSVGLVAETLHELGVPLEQSHALGEAIYARAGGHPYFTQRLGALLEEAQHTGHALTVPHVDAALQQVLAGDSLLNHLARALQENDYRPAVKTLLRERVRFSRQIQDLARLELLGLAKESHGFWQVRNPLLERALRDWLDSRKYAPAKKNLSASIVALCTDEGSIVGTGFLVDDRVILTCAHVVVAAGGGPSSTVSVRFHITGDKCPASVVSDQWRASDGDDVAVLRLEVEAPESAAPVQLENAANCAGHSFRAFGYPSLGDIEGLWATGKIEGLVSEAGRQLLQLNSQNLAQGMSGGPVLDETTHRVVGMITSVNHPDATTKHRDTAFATPAEILRAILEDLR